MPKEKWLKHWLLPTRGNLGSVFDFSGAGWLAPRGPGAKFVCQIPGQLADPALCDQLQRILEIIEIKREIS